MDNWKFLITQRLEEKDDIAVQATHEPCKACLSHTTFTERREDIGLCKDCATQLGAYDLDAEKEKSLLFCDSINSNPLHQMNSISAIIFDDDIIVIREGGSILNILGSEEI